MSDNLLLPFFQTTTKIKEIRGNQKEALDKIEKLLSNRQKRIIVSAPVGSGKGALGNTIINYFIDQDKRGLYSSPLNELVDQIDESEFGFKTLKGRRHYDCISKLGYNCDLGFCKTEKCPDSPRKRDCKNKPYKDCEHCLCWKCNYKAVFRAFRNSSKGNTNFTLFMMGITNNPDVIILDEADTIEGTVRDFNSVTIPIVLKDVSFVKHIEPLKVYQSHIDEMADKINPELSDKAFREREELIKLSGKISLMIEDYESFKEPWVVTTNPQAQKTHYQPITIDRFLEPLLSNTTVVLMSATPPRLLDYTMIEVDSVFPIETRQWIYHPIGKMSRDYRDKIIPKVATWLKELQGKTIVHCVSYDTARKIAEALRALKVFPLQQTNGNNQDNENTVSRYDAVQSFIEAKDEDKILLSVKLDRGVDFWQPEIVNNVIACLPYPNPTEPLVKAKNKVLGRSWQNEKMMQDICQASGRIHRNEKLGIYKGVNIPKKTYIIDKNFESWYAKNKKLFPKWYREAEYKTKEAL